MIEVEIRAKVDNFDNIKRELAKLGAKLTKSVKQMDKIYGSDRFLDSDNFIIEGGIVPRIREVDDKKRLEFKEISRQKGGFDLSMNITDISIAERFLKKLDFEEAFTIKKSRESYSYKDFTICLDDVYKLGKFIEIEKTLPSEEGKDAAREECIALLKIIAPGAEIENKKYGDLMQELKNKGEI